MQKTFTGKVHKFILNGQERFVLDPRTIPADIRDSLCKQNNYWLPSIIGPNHKVAHYDMAKQAWRDMRNASLVKTEDRTIIHTEVLGWHSLGCQAY